MVYFLIEGRRSDLEGLDDFFFYSSIIELKPLPEHQIVGLLGIVSICGETFPENIYFSNTWVSLQGL